jgi:hypothetical protein
MSTFIPTNGTGALFAKSDFETGEISITGNWTSPEGLDMQLTAVLLEDGSLSISGELAGHPEISCTGLLMPTEYAGGYKAGVISIQGKDRVREYKVNSKGRVDRNNLPYRFIWMASNRVAI